MEIRENNKYYIFKAFEYQGIRIENPFFDETYRYKVDPTKYYGIKIKEKIKMEKTINDIKYVSRKIKHDHFSVKLTSKNWIITSNITYFFPEATSLQHAIVLSEMKYKNMMFKPE